MAKIKPSHCEISFSNPDGEPIELEGEVETTFNPNNGTDFNITKIFECDCEIEIEFHDTEFFESLRRKAIVYEKADFGCGPGQI